METKAKTTSLSKYLGVKRKDLEKVDVFDAILGIDTKLFIDPKLVTRTKLPQFIYSKSLILNYFGRLIKIHKQSDKVERLQKIAQGMLAIPEPIGLSIGYGNKTDNGTSIPKN